MPRPSGPTSTRIEGPVVLVGPLVRRLRHHERGDRVEERQGAGLRRCVHPGRGPAGRGAHGRGFGAGPGARQPDVGLQARADPRRAAGDRRHVPPAERRRREFRERRVGRGCRPDLRHPATRHRSPASPSRPVRPAWKDIPSWALIGTQDRIIDAGLPARDGRACRRAGHRGRRLARLDGLEARCRRRAHRAGRCAR